MPLRWNITRSVARAVGTDHFQLRIALSDVGPEINELLFDAAIE